MRPRITKGEIKQLIGVMQFQFAVLITIGSLILYKDHYQSIVAQAGFSVSAVLIVLGCFLLISGALDRKREESQKGEK